MTYEQTWKLKEGNRLLDIVDPELTSYDETEVLRFIKVALFCTQAAAHHRPTMKQVVKMLSKEVHINDMALTEPGVYRWHASKKEVSSSDVTSTSQVNKFKRPENQFSGTDIVTQMFPR